MVLEKCHAAHFHWISVGRDLMCGGMVWCSVVWCAFGFNHTFDFSFFFSAFVFFFHSFIHIVALLSIQNALFNRSYCACALCMLVSCSHSLNPLAVSINPVSYLINTKTQTFSSSRCQVFSFFLCFAQRIKSILLLLLLFRNQNNSLNWNERRKKNTDPHLLLYSLIRFYS